MACSGKLKLFRKDVLLSALEEGSEDPKEELEHNHGILRALETTASREETESGEDEISDDERERLFRRTKSNVDGHERRGSARRRLCAIFFLNSFGFSIYLPYFVLFVKEKVGLSAGQVGIIAALEIVGGYAVSPLVSLFVDRYRRHRLVWLTSIISCIVPIESVPLAKTFGAALGLALVTAVLKAPSGSILNAYTLALVSSSLKSFLLSLPHFAGEVSADQTLVAPALFSCSWGRIRKTMAKCDFGARLVGGSDLSWVDFSCKHLERRWLSWFPARACSRRLVWFSPWTSRCSRWTRGARRRMPMNPF